MGKEEQGTDNGLENGLDAEGKVAADASADADAEKAGTATQTLEEKLETARQEAAQSYDRFLRTVAELENFKKRAAREQSDLRKYATEGLLKDLLPVVDNLERAIDSGANGNGEADPGRIVEGVAMTLSELVKVLDKHQVKPVDPVGEPFDPAYHQAFMTEESDDHPENTVIKAFQKGYLLHDRLLRPAMVVVSKTRAKDASGDPETAADS